MKLRHYLFLLLGIIFLYLFVVAVLSPVSEIKWLNSKYQETDPAEMKSKESYSNTEYRDLALKEAYMDALLATAKKDSICLIVDFHDSLLVLAIGGVEVHKVKIIRFRGLNFFRRLELPVVQNLFSTPLRVTQNFSCIPKEPIIIKRAPKDTTEADSPSEIPDTANKESVCFRFTTDKGIILDVRQIENAEDHKYGQYKRHEMFKWAGGLIEGAFHFQIPEYQPRIMIQIPRSEARTIYRALPRNALIAVRV